MTTVCVTREEIDGYTARDVLSFLGVSGRKVRNLSLEAEITVRVPGIRAETAELAKAEVDEAAVKKALKKLGLNADDISSFTLAGEPMEDRDSAYNSVRNNNDDGDEDDD